MVSKTLGILSLCAAAAAAALWITPCHARYLEVKEPPAAPQITFPAGTTNGLTTNVAWIGDVHDALEVTIADTPWLSAEAVWNSGTVETVDNYLHCGPLPSDHALYAFVRLRNSAGWGPWSTPARFHTPRSPVVRIISPKHASSLRGTSLTVEWTIDSDMPLKSLHISLDKQPSVLLDAADTHHTFETLPEGVHTATITAECDSRRVEEQITFYLYKPAQLAAAKLYTLDLTHLRRVDVTDSEAAEKAFETLHAAACLQGLVNRDRPRLYVYFTKVDRFWLKKMREPGAYLEHAELTPVASLDEAIGMFQNEINGLVVWDPEVPCTSNIASTIAGVEGLIPVCGSESSNSLLNTIIETCPKLRVAQDLRGKFNGAGLIPDSDLPSTGSAKCDAYLWTKMKYIDTGKCNPKLIGYWCDAFWLKAPQDMSLDNVGLTNHDYVVARKGFFCDLNVWTDEPPRDEPTQRPGLDCETLQEVLLSCHKASKGAMTHFAGFTPWAMKYTTHGNAGGTHDAVPTEWETARIGSAYNCYMDADAIGYVGMANASVFSHCPLPDRLVQNPPPTRADLMGKGYLDSEGSIAHLNFVYHYLGDYDSAAWIYNRMPELWANPVRGRIPSGWAFNPSLMERIPIAFDWFYSTKTPADYFIAGDSGAGYVNPTQLLPPREPSGLESAAEAWIDHNTHYYRKLNYSITGFLINGFCGELTDESNQLYSSFSGDGIMTQLHWMPKDKKNDHMLSNIVVAGMKQDITAPIDVVVEAILKHGKPDETAFLSFRSILIGSDWIEKVNNTIRAQKPDCRFEPVDPYTYFYLLKHSLGGKVEKRATYTFDTMPDELKSGSAVTISVGIRNDGWDTWKSTGPQATCLVPSFGNSADGVDIPLTQDVPPGGAAVLTFTLIPPSQAGIRDFKLDMRTGENGWFSNAGDMPWQRTVQIR